MRRFKHLLAPARNIVAFAGILGLVLHPTTYGHNAPPASQQDGSSPGQGNQQRADPCELLAEALGHAVGHDTKCPPLGSSGGVARGDFNGDGFADLAVGVPFEDIVALVGLRAGTVTDAGAVNVIYGSGTGLVATSETVPSSQFWHQDASGVLDTAESGDRFGTALAAGDFNGDGFSDIAIAVPGERDAGGNQVGAVHILYGSGAGLTSVGDQLFLASNFSTSFPSSGVSLVWADFNGDGFGDLAVEARGIGVAQVLVLPGSSTGLSAAGTQLLSFDICAVGDCGEVLFVDLVLAAGDFNRDSRSELVIGAPFGPGGVQNAGNVRILTGTASGLSLTGVQLLHQNVTGVPEVAEFGDQFGAALAVGDFDGDSFPDLAVGVPGEDNGIRFAEAGAVLNPNSISNGGAVNVFLTSAGPQILFEAQIHTIEGGPAFGDRDVEPNDRIGSALAAGDFNDDGFMDLAIGAPGETLGGVTAAGSVSVLYASASGFAVNSFASEDRQFWTETSFGATPASGDNFGSSLSAWNFGRNHNVVFRGPVTTADLAIGIPRKDVSGRTDAGAVRVIYGFTTGLATSTAAYNEGPLTAPRPGPSQLWHQDVTGVPDACEANDRFGSAVY